MFQFAIKLQIERSGKILFKTPLIFNLQRAGYLFESADHENHHLTRI